MKTLFLRTILYNIDMNNRLKKFILSAALFLAALALVIFLTYDPNGKTQILQAIHPSSTAASATPAVTAAVPESPRPELKDKALHIYFLNVAQGDCAFLHSPNGKTMLLDAGEAEKADVVLSFLEAQRVDGLDMLVASHLHSDHVGAMPAVIYSCTPECFVMPKGAGQEDVLFSALSLKNVPIISADSNSELVWDEEVSIDLLSPLPGMSYSDENQGSLIMRLQYGSTAVLFTGDAGYEAEDIALRANEASRFSANVLKLGHHGSSDSTTPRFLRAVGPKYAVVSCGLNNSYSHPHQSVLNQLERQGIQVFRTDLNGIVHVAMDGENILIESER